MTREPGYGTALRWLEQPSSQRGLRFAGDRGDEWTFRSYAELSQLAGGMAGRLRQAGVRPGDTVLLMIPTSPLFVAGFFGAILAGAVPAPLASPAAFAGRIDHVENFERAAKATSARAVVTVPGIAALLAGTATRLGTVVVTADLDGADIGEAEPVDFRRAPTDTALIQFSSGSTGTPRGIRLSRAAVDANVASILRWLAYTEDDSLASWLPLYHDMGLIGCLVAPMAVSSDVWLMPPDQFIRSPARWLRCFGRSGVTTTAAPTFGLSHVLRRVRPEDLTGMDLTGWRTLIVGAEMVDPAVVAGFTELMKPYGFDARAVLPAYGMAEATLAVTGASHGTEIRTLTVDPASLQPGRVVTPAVAPGGRTLVGCGGPLPGMQVGIIDEHGHAVGAGIVGEVVISGPSLADGYVGEGAEDFVGVLRTGDIGFQSDGELFVVGRAGDSIKQLGRWMFAEEVERIAVRVSPRPHQTVGLLGNLRGRSTAAVVVEGSAGDAAARIGTAVANAAPYLRVLVLSAPTGWTARTTSGKPRRRIIWDKIAAEAHGGATVAWDSGVEGAAAT